MSLQFSNGNITLFSNAQSIRKMANSLNLLSLEAVKNEA